MKAFLRVLPLFLIATSLFARGKDPVLMYINDRPVHKSEFEYIYNKNNSNNTLDKKTLDEYVELFINFKLKVEEAKTQGLDTTRAFISELNGYRSQLTRPFLTDSKVEESILIEAYNRLKEDVEVSHILIRVDYSATPEDTLIAWNKINDLAGRVNNDNFATIAKAESEDQSAIENAGYIGWITGFRTVYPFETVAYNTPPGTISKPVRTNFGYHLIRVHNRRMSKGEVLVSHIMTFTSKGEDEMNERAKHRIDSLYKVVKGGQDFGAIASAYSEDRGSSVRNGELPWFGVGRMVQEFEQAAFALKEVGDISEPIQSPYGWHIIKLLDTKPLPSFENRRAEIERQVKRDERANKGQKAFVEQLKKEYRFRKQRGSQTADFYRLLEGRTLSDSTFIADARTLNKRMFSFAKKNFTQQDFLNYLINNPHSARTNSKDIIDEKLVAFIEHEILKHEDSQLEKKHPDFRLLMQEYHDGILLFEISNNEVWDKASKDTAGLANFFRRNKEKYRWDKPHFKGRVIQCRDEKTYRAAVDIVNMQHRDSIDLKLRQLNDSIVNIRIDRGLFVQGDNKWVDQKIFNTGIQAEIDPNFPFVYVPGTMLYYTPEDYTDVRGLVTADYQEYLERRWVEYLRNKYPVRINEKVLRTIKQN